MTEQEIKAVFANPLVGTHVFKITKDDHYHYSFYLKEPKDEKHISTRVLKLPLKIGESIERPAELKEGDWCMFRKCNDCGWYVGIYIKQEDSSHHRVSHLLRSNHHEEFLNIVVQQCRPLTASERALLPKGE